MTKDNLKNQGKILAKIGANSGVEDGPVRCNASTKCTKVRCNTLSKAQGVHWALEIECRHKNCKKGLMKSLPRSVLGWVIQQRFVKEVFKHKGQGNHKGNTPFPNGVANLLYDIYDYRHKYLP